MFNVGDTVESIPCPDAGIGVVTEVCDNRDIWVTFPTWYDKCREVPSNLRLVSPAPTGPVVTETVTKTRIVPGVYGRVNVHLGRDNPNNMYVSFTNQAGNTHSGQLLTADELDAAAAVLSALAKGLRDV